MTVLADFILVGHDSHGSFALNSSKTNLFTVALGSFLDMIAGVSKDGRAIGVVNEYAIPRLMQLNKVRPEDYPILTHGDIEQVDLGELGDYISKLANAGAPLFPKQDLENWLLAQGGLPVMEDKWAIISLWPSSSSLLVSHPCVHSNEQAGNGRQSQACAFGMVIRKSPACHLMRSLAIYRGRGTADCLDPITVTLEGRLIHFHTTPPPLRPFAEPRNKSGMSPCRRRCCPLQQVPTAVGDMTADVSINNLTRAIWSNSIEQAINLIDMNILQEDLTYASMELMRGDVGSGQGRSVAKLCWIQLDSQTLAPSIG